MSSKPERIDIDQPLWDQRTFYGRFRHFAFITDPTTVLASTTELMASKQLVEQYRAGKEPPDITRTQIIRAKKLYASAFHPDTGELQPFVGRMSFQMPGNCFITSAMLIFYSSMPAVLFWQWFNQSFNALVNYTNRNANIEVSWRSVAASYVMATSSALGAAIGFKKHWQRTAPPMMQRYVPFAVVALTNCINIPIMRRQEVIGGVEVYDEHGRLVGTSRAAGAKGIGQVVFSRVVQAVPAMVLLPYMVERLEKESKAFVRRPWLGVPFQVVMNGVFLTLMVPLSCAIFPQNCSMKMSTIKTFDGKSYERMVAHRPFGWPLPERVYFNKGL